MHRVLRDWDVIVIGSGPGGLTAALALARSGKRVLVLEQHYLPGGGMHSYTRANQGPFGPALHYIGALTGDGALGAIYRGLGVAEHLQFCRLDPDGFDRYFIGDYRIDQPQGMDRWIQRLCSDFPREQEGIRAYFRIICQIVDGLKKCGESLSFPRILTVPFRSPVLAYWSTSTLADLLNKYIRDPLLYAVLSAQCGNHGLPPSEISVLVHAAMTCHYLEGAYYPCGGPKSIAAAFIKEHRRHGGQIKTRARVAQILVENGRAVGVRLESGETLHAQHIVCNADPATVYGTLLAPEHCREQMRRVERTEYSVSAFSGFCVVEGLGLDRLRASNCWWYRTHDVERIYQQMKREVLTDRIDFLFLSASDTKDPFHKEDGRHRLEMFTLVPYDWFAAWRGSAQSDRGAEYESLKCLLGDLMLDAAERILPGLREHIVSRHFGSPLTIEHYLGSHRGALYGKASTPRQILFPPFRLKGPVEGLVFCGASALVHSIVGATMSGLSAARHILGLPTNAALLDLSGRPFCIRAPF